MCNRCGRELSEDNFSKDKSKKDGLRTICKDCTHKRQKQYREENKDKVAEAKKKYAQENIQLKFGFCFCFWVEYFLVPFLKFRSIVIFNTQNKFFEI